MAGNDWLFLQHLCFIGNQYLLNQDVAYPIYLSVNTDAVNGILPALPGFEYAN